MTPPQTLTEMGQTPKKTDYSKGFEDGYAMAIQHVANVYTDKSNGELYFPSYLQKKLHAVNNPCES